MKIKKVAIVGGGTAGWLAANHLGLELSAREGFSVTVVESKDVPTIGVGEGTVAVIRKSLEKLGVSEAELLLRCDATFKMGIKFVNWMAPKKDNFYYHPFDAPYPLGVDATDYWLSNKPTGSFYEFSELAKTYLAAEGNLCPKLRNSPPYQGVVNYAYHFDAKKFSELLADNAKRRFDVLYKQKTVLSANLDDNGFIESLNYDDGETEGFDFFVDCSGFSALLMEKALGVGLVDKSDQIAPDQALVLQVATSSDDEIAPYTTATAHTAGWIWDIPLTTRRGTGFVYSSAHMTEQQAMAEFELYHGANFCQSKVRKIPLKTGYREKFWLKNCTSLGLAQGFVEPLESTSIVITDYCASLIAKLLPDHRDHLEARAQQVNRRVEYIWERVIDFVQLHYLISDRQDSAFWRDCTAPTKMSDLLRERLLLWKNFIPTHYDFSADIEFFQRESFLAILYGMNYPTKALENNAEYDEFVKVKVAEHFQAMTSLAESLTPQRQWINEFYAYAANVNKV
ncbi:tryptophan halogenase family protein [Gilvimarinus polysaccharolyticus]|uniref:tryptophan halogenase family protein n=1 Tax=Gilvimarinus polysaccharolyticus TaxID=863921 RepID=UPI0006735E6C|nr:tryptophan halogenase family protein [Gilvimarinus polysaccharolyticus]